MQFSRHPRRYKKARTFAFSTRTGVNQIHENGLIQASLLE
ncbi:hypothetical protein HMPREF7215_1760 [Pyramidobacter piscolens W5455]|uniref:Uncharacterized protein n=1 Tax=Pyramidobacter piscolens W5455 TaxID=352165 RepID=A0ABM9ZY16_9BACT|nr:hypothetical protein HMPREF7215_1760 [Pyramidobacter piscolens W5455]